MGRYLSRSAARVARDPAASSPDPVLNGVRDNLIRLHEWHSEVTSKPRFGRAGLFFTFAGVLLGAVIGGAQSGLTVFAPRAARILQIAVPAVLGGGLGALIGWVRTRRWVTAAVASASEFRRRLTLVERNQALWVSLSAVLHDVRNPLHTITLLLESLDHASSDVAKVREQVREQLATINLRIRRVMNQVSALSGEIRRRPVGLAGVAKEVTEMIGPLARRSAIEFSFQVKDGIVVQADDRLLAQALDHLALNSLQILMDGQGESNGQSESKGWLHLSARNEGQQVCILVEDNGPGLPAAVQERLFEPLGDGKGSSMGLGLAIAHALAQAAGGNLELGETGPGGTQFRFLLDRP
ncbi:MAG: ATP-binding protein [Acidiferrobacteraceae bacterium]